MSSWDDSDDLSLLANISPQREEIVWANTVEEGFFRRKVKEYQAITTARVRLNDQSIPLQLLDDIIVMNRHSVSKGSYVSTGRYVRVGYGHSHSRTVGDVAFIYKGAPAIVFYQLADPYGLQRLAKATRKALISQMKIKQKTVKIESKVSPSLRCPKCNAANPTKARFCNSCGMAIATGCTKCGKDNPAGSSFCAECGSPLR